MSTYIHSRVHWQRYAVSVLAGTWQTPGYDGDGGLAVSALIDNPFGVTRGACPSICLSTVRLKIIGNLETMHD